MEVKIQQVKMQRTLLWTGRYQTLYDVEYWYWPNAEIKICRQRKRSGSNFKIDLKLKFSSHIVNQVK